MPDVVDIAGAGEELRQDLPQAPAAPVLGDGGSGEILPDEEREDARQAPAAPPAASAVVTVDDGRPEQAPAAPVVGDDRGSGEIRPDEEEGDARQAPAPAAPPAASAAVTVDDGRTEQAPAANVVGDDRGSGEILPDDEEEDARQAPADPPAASAAVTVDDGQTEQAPAAHVVGDHRGSREIRPDEEEGDARQAPEAPPAASAVVTVDDGPPEQDPAAHVVGDDPDSGEIRPDEEEEDATRQAPAAPPTASAVVTVDGQAPGALDVESRGGQSRSPNLRTVTWANNWGTLFCALAHPKFAKWVYTAFFAGGIVLAMSSRYAEVSAFTTRRVNGYNDDRFLLDAESALRVSLAFFIFFTVMFITTVGTKKVHECRNFWNSNLGGPLLVKIFILLSCLYLVQVPPTAFIQLYGNIARAGAWLFLVIQLVSLTRFFMMLNIMQESITNRWRWLVQAVTIIANLGSFGAILWLLRGHTSDLVDLTIVGVTIMLMLLMIIIHFKTQATTSWLAPGLMLSYIVFMCWTVIISEPHRESTKAKDPKGPDWLTYMSLFFMAFSALSTGVDDWIQFNDEEPSEDNIPYGFGYFHLVFALGSMYFGMIIVGWNAHQTMERWTIDVGWWSAVVRAANGVVAAVLYTWMLRTPFIWSKTKLVLSWPEASWIPHVTFL